MNGKKLGILQCYRLDSPGLMSNRTRVRTRVRTWTQAQICLQIIVTNNCAISYGAIWGIGVSTYGTAVLTSTQGDGRRLFV